MSEGDERVEASLFIPALRRSVAPAVVLAVAAPLNALIFGTRASELWLYVMVGLLSGFGTMLLSALELHAKRLDAERRPDVLLTLLSFSVAYAVLGVAFLQVCYFFKVVVEGDGLLAAVEQCGHLLRLALVHERELLLLVLLFVLPVLPLTYARLRGMRLSRQLAFALPVSSVLALPIGALLFGVRLTKDWVLILGPELITAAALVISFALGERFDRWCVARKASA